MNDPTNDRFLNAPQKGGGSLNAGEQLDRQCYTVELDQKFCDVIVRRYIEYAGTNAEVFLIRCKTLTPYADLLKEANHV